MLQDELTELSVRLQMLGPRRRSGWVRFCRAAKLLEEYGDGEEKAAGEVFAALVLVESTIEALELRRLQSIERVALDCGRQAVREAWRRLDDEQAVGCQPAAAGETVPARRKVRLRQRDRNPTASTSMTS
jgi:hypothetical protein